MVNTKPLKYYKSFLVKPLIFNLVDVGEGLMILIVFPDETTMLYDCNVRQEEKERIIDYLGKYIPYRYDFKTMKRKQWIDIFVNSHRDQDHYRGLSEIQSVYEIKSIWDSGQTGEATKDGGYQYYMRLRRYIIDKYGKDKVLVPTPSIMPIENFGNAEIYCLNSSQEYNEYYNYYFSEALFNEAKIQHSNSIVLLIKYSGRAILLSSDSDWKSWKEKIVPNFADKGMLKADILVASHHGSRSFFTDENENDEIDFEKNPDTTYIESIKYISPAITLIPCGDYNEYHHPNRDALKIYKKYTENEQVYTTKKKGSFCGFINCNGVWTTVPSRFESKSNHRIIDFNIKCLVKFNGESYYASSNDNFPIGCELLFSIDSKRGLSEPYSSLKVTWEVANGGINEYHTNQDIYFKNENEEEPKEKFWRKVAFEGRHLLRCRVINKQKKIDITRIFVVNGVLN